MEIRHIELPEFWWVWLYIDWKNSIIYVNDCYRPE